MLLCVSDMLLMPEFMLRGCALVPALRQPALLN